MRRDRPHSLGGSADAFGWSWHIASPRDVPAALPSGCGPELVERRRFSGSGCGSRPIARLNLVAVELQLWLRGASAYDLVAMPCLSRRDRSWARVRPRSRAALDLLSPARASAWTIISRSAASSVPAVGVDVLAILTERS